jgi:hypothetical protein
LGVAVLHLFGFCFSLMFENRRLIYSARKESEKYQYKKAAEADSLLT